jgi:hypothetical protein
MTAQELDELATANAALVDAYLRQQSALQALAWLVGAWRREANASPQARTADAVKRSCADDLEGILKTWGYNQPEQ